MGRKITNKEVKKARELASSCSSWVELITKSGISRPALQARGIEPVYRPKPVVKPDMQAVQHIDIDKEASFNIPPPRLPVDDGADETTSTKALSVDIDKRKPTRRARTADMPLTPKRVLKAFSSSKNEVHVEIGPEGTTYTSEIQVAGLEGHRWDSTVFTVRVHDANGLRSEDTTAMFLSKRLCREAVNETPDAELTVVEDHDGELVLQAGNTMVGRPADMLPSSHPAFPKWDDGPRHICWSEEAPSLKELKAFAQKFTVAAVSERRPVLTGINFLGSENGGEHAGKAVSTDSFSLSLINPPAPVTLPSSEDMSVHNLAFKRLGAVASACGVHVDAPVEMEIATEVPEDANIYEEGATVTLSCGDVEVQSKAIFGEFPPWEKLVPSASVPMAEITNPAATAKWLRKMKKESGCATNEGRVQLTFEEENGVTRPMFTVTGLPLPPTALPPITEEPGYSSVTLDIDRMISALETIPSGETASIRFPKSSNDVQDYYLDPVEVVPSGSTILDCEAGTLVMPCA